MFSMLSFVSLLSLIAIAVGGFLMGRFTQDFEQLDLVRIFVKTSSIYVVGISLVINGFHNLILCLYRIVRD